MVQGQAFNGRQFSGAVILWVVLRCLMFPVSHRNLERVLQDRSVAAVHTTLF